MFKLIDKPNALVTDIWAKANRVMIDLNGIEREALPAFVKAALVDREVILAGPPPTRWGNSLVSLRVRSMVVPVSQQNESTARAK